MEVLLNGYRIEVTMVEMRIMIQLADSHEKIFSREQIVNKIYDDHGGIVSDRTIDSHVKNYATNCHHIRILK